MNENIQDTTEQTEASAASSGKLLRVQREARNLSVEEVAHALKLQPRQVVAMEAGDFASLGSLPFARGFVRNYARFIGFDAAAVLAGLEQQAPLPKHELGEGDGPRVAMPEPGRRKPLTWILAVSPLILVAVVAVVLYAVGLNLDGLRSLLHSGAESSKPVAVETAPSLQVVQPAGNKPEAPASQPLAVPPAAVQAPAIAPPAPAPAAPATPAAAPAVPPAAAMPAPAASTVAPAAPAAQAAPVAGMHHLALSVESESWVEVKSEGRTVVSQKFAAGQSRNLDGKGPFVVVIGNAKGAQVKYEDKAVDLVPHTKVNVARLILN